jgi:predicted ATPase
LPLAIELASARARAFTPAQISAHLKDRLRALPTGPRTAPARQATLRASFDWSYELLTDAERALLRQLSVFAGGCDLEAALAVCPAASAEVLAALVDRSLLLVQDDRKRGEPRYRMLETIREFAAECLAEAGEVDALRSLHRDHYLAVAETGEAGLGGPGQAEWFARLRVEQDNLRAALAWSRDHEEADALARMVVALAQFWMDTVRLIDIQLWLGAAADRAICHTALAGPDTQPRVLSRHFHQAFVGGGARHGRRSPRPGPRRRRQA